MKPSKRDLLRAEHKQEIARIAASYARAFFNKGQLRMAIVYQKQAYAAARISRGWMGLDV